MDRIDWAALIIAVGVVSCQIFVPPVIGLADDGDFAKIIGRFDLYAPGGQTNGFIAVKYAIDPKHHWRGDFISSEILLAGVAVGLNRIFSSTVFDLRWIGAVHGALYLLAFYLALPLVRQMPTARRIVVLATIVLVLGDVMYVSALNSFYMDTAAWVFLVLCIVLYLRGSRLGLLVSLMLLLTAKTQHIAAGCIVLGLVLLTWPRRWVSAAIAIGCLGTMIAYIGTPWDYVGIQPFNIIFYGLLPHSDSVDRDLEELGLDESYKRWKGMHAYSEGSPMTDLNFVREFRRRTGFGQIALYYARHPSQPWRILIENLSDAGRERPYLGNYDKQTGAREFQESNAFARWSGLKRVLLWHRPMLYLGYVLAQLALICGLVWKQGLMRVAAIAFVVLTIMEMLIGSIGDVLDGLRHEFVFNGVADLGFVFVIALLMCRHAREPLPEQAVDLRCGAPAQL